MARNRRVEKTKEALFRALSTLLKKKKYSEISIQEIIDAADVGRSTFYSHFCTKDELLKALVEKIFDSLRSHSADRDPDIPVRGLFEHIQANITQIRGIIADPTSCDVLFRKIKTYWKKHLTGSGVLSASPAPCVPEELFVNHLVQTLIECVRWWIETRMKHTPQEMERYYYALTGIASK